MGRKKSKKNYYELAQSRGFTWVDCLLPVNTRTNTKWQCPKGHVWEATYAGIYRGNLCPDCSAISEEDYCSLAEKRGFQWVDVSIPKRTVQKTKWQCSRGHVWNATYNNVRQGSGCPHCARKQEEDYHALAKKCGFIWMGNTLPQNSSTKTKWKCRRGHTWETTYNSVQQGFGCHYCPRVEESDYHTLAKERGFKWVDEVLPYTTVKTKWQCEKGHLWEATYSNIKQGSGCSYCARKQEEDYHELAKKRGFKWSDATLPPNTNSKTKWQCEKGHLWKATYSSIKQGSGCPLCARKLEADYVSRAVEEGPGFYQSRVTKKANLC